MFVPYSLDVYENSVLAGFFNRLTNKGEMMFKIEKDLKIITSRELPNDCTQTVHISLSSNASISKAVPNILCPFCAFCLKREKYIGS